MALWEQATTKMYILKKETKSSLLNVEIFVDDIIFEEDDMMGTIFFWSYEERVWNLHDRWDQILHWTSSVLTERRNINKSNKVCEGDFEEIQYGGSQTDRHFNGDYLKISKGRCEPKSEWNSLLVYDC